MKPLFLRLFAGGVLGLLIAAKFFVFSAVKQISLEEINSRTLQVLSESSIGPALQKKQPRRKELQQFQFNLSDCVSPYFALQALTLEDPGAVLEAAKPFPLGLNPHVIYLGEELEISNRLGLKLTAVRKFISYRLGLSSERPAAYLYIILSRPGCTGYRNINWSKVWAS